MKHRLQRSTLLGSTLLLLAVSLSACSLFDEDIDGDALEIHLQSSFDGEWVQVKVDGRTVYDERVATDHRIGLADVVRLERAEGLHRIEVTVEGGYRTERAFALEDRLFIGVTFFQQAIPAAGLEEGVHLRFSDTGFGYE